MKGKSTKTHEAVEQKIDSHENLVEDDNDDHVDPNSKSTTEGSSTGSIVDIEIGSNNPSQEHDVAP